MNNYITGATIKMLREKQQLTQSQLADKLCVSDKTISKWETGKWVSDISAVGAAGQLAESFPSRIIVRGTNYQSEPFCQYFKV